MLLAESPPLSALDLLLAYDKDPDGAGARLEQRTSALCMVSSYALSDCTSHDLRRAAFCVLQARAPTASSPARSGW